MNEVILQGNLVDVPDFNSEGESLRCSSTLAVNERYRDSFGEWQQGKAQYIPVTVWGQLAENAFASLTKGDRAVVIGKLKIRNVKQDDETYRTYAEVVAESVSPSLTFTATQPVERVA